jgi:hypothetical protein
MIRILQTNQKPMLQNRTVPEIEQTGTRHDFRDSLEVFHHTSEFASLQSSMHGDSSYSRSMVTGPPRMFVNLVQATFLEPLVSRTPWKFFIVVLHRRKKERNGMFRFVFDIS